MPSAGPVVPEVLEFLEVQEAVPVGLAVQGIREDQKVGKMT
ncbi:hypothetical protein PghCCS26_59140 [Paenibacillus glycanilyticus]|uniref:Uncharacterized protein n=1 Tax=Paenibacillus glycanilyticus TaxID=126569 RepID=A0ABQ6NW98_9BACL|nr:hypothetical protein PghCCS26_59140 [Paenibacillus glycanilyticus]